MKTSWDIACEWYTPDDIYRSIQRHRSIAFEGTKIPEDVYSHEFAVWLCDQYRLAMNKGFQLERERQGKEIERLRTALNNIAAGVSYERSREIAYAALNGDE